MCLHIVEKAERESIEIENFGMDAEIAFSSRNKPRTKLKELLSEQRRHGEA